MIRNVLLFFIFLAAVFTSCSKNPSKNLTGTVDFDFISKRENILEITDFNSTDYFLYKGEPLVFTYNLMGSYPDFKKSKQVSVYDDMIRHFSASIKWDWRLLASLICQESHFDPTVESGRGAIGLMQIMPETAKNFGIDVSSSAENNMEAGVKYINWLHKIFDPKISDEKERINFILAAYNAGPGHVLDAMKLAEKNGMNPQKWNGNVAVWLLKKSQPEYYNDAVVKNGYFKGVESVNFVSQVLERFEHYKNIIQ